MGPEICMPALGNTATAHFAQQWKTTISGGVLMRYGSFLAKLNLNLNSILLMAATVVPFLSFPALAASFDCDHAETKMEQLVCSDLALSKADEKLAAAYEQALKAANDPESVKQQQREWLSDTANHCDSVACLKDAYAERIRQLEAARKQAGPKA
jgi:uncharacterized protein YecT (DUF1311 family)